MADQEQWQLDGTAAELYQRHLVPAVTALWAADLADRAVLAPGERVLDVACGTGVVARVAAERVGAAGSVDAIDVNAGMLAVARSLPGAVRWHHGSALELPFADGRFDVVLCQLGLQFLSDRPLALREMRRVLASDRRLALNVFGPIEHNPATHALADALDRRLGADASRAKRTEHALADPEQLRALVAQAGFRAVAIDTARKTVRFASPAEYVAIQLAATPLAAVVADDDRVAAVVADVTAALGPYVGHNGLAFPQEVLVVLARA
jgi:ubiquinone/menaquinone biosynthesis C-methylase UbiE